MQPVGARFVHITDKMQIWYKFGMTQNNCVIYNGSFLNWDQITWIASRFMQIWSTWIYSQSTSQGSLILSCINTDIRTILQITTPYLQGSLLSVVKAFKIHISHLVLSIKTWNRWKNQWQQNWTNCNTHFYIPLQLPKTK